MNWVDLFIAAGLVAAGVYGWHAGLSRCLLSLAGLIGSVWLSLARGGWLGDLFAARIGLSPVAAAWIGAGLILGLSLAAFLLLISLLDRLLRSSTLGPADAIAGGFLALLNGALCLGLALSFLSLHPLHSGIPSRLRASFLAGPIQRVSKSLIEGVRRVSPSAEVMLARLRADRESAVSRSPEVVEAISRGVGQVRAELDTLISRSVGDSSAPGVRAPTPRPTPVPRDTTQARHLRKPPRGKPSGRDTTKTAK